MGDLQKLFRPMAAFSRAEGVQYLYLRGGLAIAANFLMSGCGRPVRIERFCELSKKPVYVRGVSGEVELHSTHLVDARLSAPAAAVNTERSAGSPKRAAVSGFCRARACSGTARASRGEGTSLRVYRGGSIPTGSEELRVVGLVQAKIVDDLALAEMGEPAGISTGHFSRAFC